MDSGTKALRRTSAAIAVGALLAMSAACGAADHPSAGTGGAASTAGTKAASPPKAAGAASSDGMGAGCDTVHKLFGALDAGDTATAESLKKKGAATFKTIAATSAKKDEQLSSNATAMAQMLDFDLPEKPIYKSELATIYKVDCVAQYGAAALPS